MGKIEKKLFRLGVRFLLAGLLAVVAVSAAALLILKSTSAYRGGDGQAGGGAVREGADGSHAGTDIEIYGSFSGFY